MSAESPIPKQIEKFWSCDKNKENIQLLSRKSENPLLLHGSVVLNNELIPAKHAGKEVAELNNWVEEGEMGIIPHIDWAIRSKNIKRFVILSNDADAFAYLCAFLHHFLSLGAKEIWLQYGTGEGKRTFPMHQLPLLVGISRCRAIMKLHILSGQDCIIRVGTKLAALMFTPENFLENFGESAVIDQQQVAAAEEYLVKVWNGANSKTCCKTFDELRLEKYKGRYALDTLPPTSSSIRGHIFRGGFLIYHVCNLLNKNYLHLDPKEYAWEESNGMMLPSKFLNLVPANKLCKCSCGGKCSKAPCKCSVFGEKCTMFCHDTKKNSTPSPCINKL